MSIHAFDLNADGVVELITGWSNGKVSTQPLIEIWFLIWFVVKSLLISILSLTVLNIYCPCITDWCTKWPHRRSNFQRQLFFFCCRSCGGRLQAGRTAATYLHFHRRRGYVFFCFYFFCVLIFIRSHFVTGWLRTIMCIPWYILFQIALYFFFFCHMLTMSNIKIICLFKGKVNSNLKNTLLRTYTALNFHPGLQQIKICSSWIHQFISRPQSKKHKDQNSVWTSFRCSM